MKLSTLTGRPAHDGGCYHCDRGAKSCICPGKAEDPAPVSPVDKFAYETLSRPFVPHYVPKEAHMPNHLMTQDATLDALQGLRGEHFMTDFYDSDVSDDEPLFPRRRDVREMCEEVLHAMLYCLNSDSEFDRDFLTDVRDLMREGVPFADAVGSFAPEIYVDDEAAWEAYHAVIGLEDALTGF